MAIFANWRRARTAGIVVFLTTMLVLLAQNFAVIEAQFAPQPQLADDAPALPTELRPANDVPLNKAGSQQSLSPSNAGTKAPAAEVNPAAKPASVPSGGKLLDTLRKRGDITLRDASLRQALFAISENWQVSIVVGPDIDGKVDGSFHDAPLFELLDSLLTVNGFGYRATGNNLVVGRLEALAGENPLFETTVIELANAYPDDLINLAKPQTSLQGRLESFGNNGLLIADYPEIIAKVRKLTKQYDLNAPARNAKPVGADPTAANNSNNSATAASLLGSGVSVAQFQLKHNSATILAEPVKTILTREGKVTVMESENRLIVVDYPHAIETIQKLVSELDAPGTGLKVAQFAPSHLRVSSLAEAARSLLSKDGRINVNDSENRMIVIDYPHVLNKVTGMIEDADTPRNGLKSIELRSEYTDAKDLQGAMASLMSKDGKIALVDNENRLVISDYPVNIERIQTMFRQIDLPRPQVRITALIYDMSMEDIYRLGLNWNHALKDNHNAAGTAQTGFTIDSLMQVPQAAGSPASVITLWNLNRTFDIRAVIDAMNNCNDSRLLADPSVVVVDRKTAQFKIVTEVPLQQLTQTGQTNIGTTQFKEAGVVLKVTPRMSADETIEMQLTPTFSRLAGYTPGQTPQPIFDSREADTTVRIANQQVFVIGGLRQRNEINQNRGIPGLKDIKKFQFHRLWSSEGREFRESELIVFVSPEIVTPCYSGRPREQMAAEQGFETLDQVPAFGGAHVPGSMPQRGMPTPQYQPYPSWQQESVPAGPTHRPSPQDELPLPESRMTARPSVKSTNPTSTPANSSGGTKRNEGSLQPATPVLAKPTNSVSQTPVKPATSSGLQPKSETPRLIAPVALYQDALPMPTVSSSSPSETLPAPMPAKTTTSRPGVVPAKSPWGVSKSTSNPNRPSTNAVPSLVPSQTSRTPPSGYYEENQVPSLVR